MSTNLPATPENLIAGLQNVANTARQAAGPVDGLQYMKFAKGEWVFGAEDTPIEDDSLWALNPMSIRQGFQAWVDNELAGEETASMFEPPIVKTALPAVATGGENRGWQSVIVFNMKCTKGEDEGTEVEFKTSSVGGIKEASKMINTILAQVSEDPSKPVPIIELSSDSYKHKKFGKVYTPVMEVKQWISMETTNTQAIEKEPEPEVEKEEEPAAKPTRRRQRK